MFPSRISPGVILFKSLILIEPNSILIKNGSKISWLSLQKNNENLLTNKTILKDIRNKLFEGKYVNKKKEGFVMSYKAVMNKNTKKFLDNLFEKKFLLDQGIFDYNILNKLYLKNNKSTADYKTLYNIICFQSWFKRWM